MWPHGCQDPLNALQLVTAISATSFSGVVSVTGLWQGHRTAASTLQPSLAVNEHVTIIQLGLLERG
jgi:hypothetical protein